jgi:ribosomal protein S27AE
MKVFDEEEIVYDRKRDMEFCPKCGEDGCLMDFSETRYYVCGIGYDENDCVVDYECDFGDFDTYEEAYECFVKVLCSDPESLFSHPCASYQMLIQLEECEEDDDEINCIDVKNEWWIENPKFHNDFLEDLIMEQQEQM